MKKEQLYINLNRTQIVRMAKDRRNGVRIFDVQRGGSIRMKESSFNELFIPFNPEELEKAKRAAETRSNWERNTIKC